MTYTVKTCCEANLDEDLANEVSEDLNKNKFRSQRSRPVWNDHENNEGMTRWRHFQEIVTETDYVPGFVLDAGARVVN